MRPRFPLLILGFALASLAFIWSRGETDGQQKVILTLVVSALSLITLAVWFVIGFHAPLRVRLGLSLGAIVALLILGATFRVRGVTGDLVPILEYRFADRSALPAAPPPSLPPASEIEPPAEGSEAVPVVATAEADAPSAPSTDPPVRPRFSIVPPKQVGRSSSDPIGPGSCPIRDSQRTGALVLQSSSGVSQWERAGPVSRRRPTSPSLSSSGTPRNG